MASATSSPPVLLVGFGEAMIRFAPEPCKDVPLPDEKGCGMFLRSVGGDELNVCVAVAQLNKGSDKPAPQWVSVLPTGPLGDVVHECGVYAGVDMGKVIRVPDSDVGIFTVLPELRTVHYQRRHSAFALHQPDALQWEQLLAVPAEGPRKWLHITGITPQVSPAARESWQRAVQAAVRLGVPVSMDFNHRKQLGTLDDLWSLTKPLLPSLQVLILSTGSLCELAQLEGVPVTVSAVDEEDEGWLALMAKLRAQWHVPRLAVCFKRRDQQGVQRRWSAIATASGVHTTARLPVLHKPKDECGGGSAWAAGLLDALWGQSVNTEKAEGDGTAVVYNSAVVHAARRADLLAALCQETIGDHSHVVRAKLESLENSHKDKEISLCGGADQQVRIEETLRVMNSAGVLAILRAKNGAAAIERGKELIALGCRAIEVTLDSDNWRQVLRELASCAPPHVAVGVGTVMDDSVSLLGEVAALGGRFALSPINPIGFIDACHALGLLAVPSGFTSNELWDLHRRGAKMIKLFHAGVVGPAGLKSMMSVSPLRALNIAPSGGVTPENLPQWWEAGARAVGMGTNLAGSDINYATGTPEYAAAVQDWQKSGREAARRVFELVAKRFA